MRYVSTRGQAPAVGFMDAVLGGLAPDGGLYMPEQWPQFTPEQIAGFASRPYAEVAAEVLSAFAGEDLDYAAALEITEEAYSAFSRAAVTPLTQLGPDLWLLELFHGPTLAFKDVAMQLLARLFERGLSRRNRRVTLVCATSGDTGGAAVEAFAGRDAVRLVVLYPEGRVSEVQRRFMTASLAQNVRCVAVDGDFDDCQALVKAMFEDRPFSEAVSLGGVNSINFARIVAQCVYYFTAAAALGAPAREAAFVAPSGNFGDGFAGYAARRMGLPVARITAATNSNDILARALTEGVYARGPSVATASVAMDIQVASNFERLYFEAVGRDGVETDRAFRAFAQTGRLDIPPAALAAMRETFDGISIDEGVTAHTLVQTLNWDGMLVCPHTAVGLAAAERRPAAAGTPTVVLSTAHAAKFPETVAVVTGLKPELPERRRGLMDAFERFDRLPPRLEAAKAYVRALHDLQAEPA